MEKFLVRFKATLLVVLLMLIATRMTWLQTSEIPVNISPTYYKTGLWVAQSIKNHCQVSPEATFPIPAGQAIRSDFIPPALELGEVSPGLAALMLVRCQFARLETDDFAKWNAWLYSLATLFAALVARILTNSWTAGLLAAVAVLSRGTLQSQSMYVTAEPFAAVFIAIGCSFVTMFMRTFWQGWSIAAVVSFACAFFFLPSLWSLGATLVLTPFLIFGFSLRKAKTTPPAIEYQALESADFSLITALTPRSWFQLGMVQLIFFAGATVALAHIMKVQSPIYDLLKINSWSLPLLHLPSIGGKILHLLHNADFHTIIALCLVFTQLRPHGRLGLVNRNTSLVFLTMLVVQFSISSITSGSGDLYSLPRGTLLDSTTKSIEPFFFGWTTGAGWRLLDHLTGYRLSNIGWSIRGVSKPI